MEARVHALLEASAAAAVAEDAVLALERAKEAIRTDRALIKFRESSADPAVVEAANHDLTFSVAFNLADAYSQPALGLAAEAESTLAAIVRNTAYPSAARLRVNLGVASLRRGDIRAALKHSRMALDWASSTAGDSNAPSARLRSRVHFNLGVLHMHVGEYAAASHAFESALEECSRSAGGTSTATTTRVGTNADGNASNDGFASVLAETASDGDAQDGTSALRRKRGRRPASDVAMVHRDSRSIPTS